VPRLAETPMTDGCPTSSGSSLPRSDEFRVRWAAHDVKLHRTGVKHFRHPLVGELTLDFESLQLPGDPGQSMLVYTAEPASPTRERLDLLASWTSTPQHLAPDEVPEQP
jgi:MmyB-like transcription regulator ligand binding domain